MPEQVVDISFPINENILLSLKETKAEFIREMLYSTALLSYRRGKLSLGKAAELAGYSKVGFMEKLRIEDESIFDYNDAEIDQIFADVDNL